MAAAGLQAEESRRSAAAADARAEAGTAAAAAASAAAARQAQGHAAGLQRLLGAGVLAVLHSLPPQQQQRVLAPPQPLLLPPLLPPQQQQHPQQQSAHMPAPATAAEVHPGSQPAVPAVQSVLAVALLLRAADAASGRQQMQAAPEQHSVLQRETAQGSDPRPPLRPAADHATQQCQPPAQPPLRPPLPPRSKQQVANGPGRRLQLPPGTPHKRPRLDARRSSATPSVQSLQGSAAARPADASLPPAAMRQAASVHASAPAPGGKREGGSSHSHRKQQLDSGGPDPAVAAWQPPVQPPQRSLPEPPAAAARHSGGADAAAAAGNAALLELLQHLQLADRRRREAEHQVHGPVATQPPDGRAAGRQLHHGHAAEVHAAATAAAAAQPSPAAAPGSSRQQWHADGRLRTAKHKTGSRSSGSAVQRPTATKSAAQGSKPSQSLQHSRQPPFTKDARCTREPSKPVASVPSHKVHASRRRAAVEEPQSASAAATAPVDTPAMAAVGDTEPPTLQPPPQPPPLSIAARLSE